MRRHTLTFERLEQELGIEKIRSVDVIPSRRMLSIVSDEKDGRTNEGGTIESGKNFTTQGDD